MSHFSNNHYLIHILLNLKKLRFSELFVSKGQALKGLVISSLISMHWTRDPGDDLQGLYLGLIAKY